MNRYPSFKICFLSSYYLKWPGCFNGCRCGDECTRRAESQVHD